MVPGASADEKRCAVTVTPFTVERFPVIPSAPRRHASQVTGKRSTVGGFYHHVKYVDVCLTRFVLRVWPSGG